MSPLGNMKKYMVFGIFYIGSPMYARWDMIRYMVFGILYIGSPMFGCSSPANTSVYR